MKIDRGQKFVLRNATRFMMDTNQYEMFHSKIAQDSLFELCILKKNLKFNRTLKYRESHIRCGRLS